MGGASLRRARLCKCWLRGQPRTRLQQKARRGSLLQMTSSVAKIPGLIRDLYTIVSELEAEFPGRKFTLDGHLVGSIGKVIAADRYGLELLPASAGTHDAKAPDGRLVQIKATQRRSVALRAEPDCLIVLRIEPDGESQEVYNGPGKPVWDAAGKMQKNGARPISVSRLRKLAAKVSPGERISDGR